jgi:WD40 repeat protein
MGAMAVGSVRTADMGIPRERVVAVVAALPGNREQIGSGYLVGERLVLTAAHCTRDKATGAVPLGLRVIRATDGATAEVIDLTVDVVAARTLDVAVVRLTNTPWGSDLSAPMFARVDRSHSGMLIDCAAIGYPLFQRAPDRRARRTAELHGTIYQTDEAEVGRLLLREPLLTSVGQEEPESRVGVKDGGSMWGGLSGALVFHAGHALGVVVEHHPRQGSAAVQLVAFDALREEAEADEATQQIADAIGLPPINRMPLVSGVTGVSTGPRRDRRAWDVHWEPRSRGVERVLVNTGWYFTGRRRVRKELCSWLTEELGPWGKGRIVTGSPGSGKSAVLARIVTLSDRDFRSQVPDVDPTLDPPAEIVDVAVHARGKSLTEVVGDIERAIGLTAHLDADWLVAQLLHRGTPLTVIVDALDEAAEPEPIARRLLRPLAHDDAAQGLRILVGARRSLLAILGSIDFDVIDLDHPHYLELGDLEAYVHARLLLDRESTPTPYRDDPEFAGQVAQAVARRAYPNFLVAQLMSRTLVQSDLPVDTTAADWMDRFPNEVGEAMETYLSGLGPDRQRVRDLLRPLAYARGDGLPPGPLWAELAGRLADGRQYQPADVAWLRESASAFLVETTSTAPNAAGSLFCRLFHEALAEHLRDSSDQRHNQRRIAEGLESCVPTVDDHPDWTHASPYITSHLAYHAAWGGHLDALVSQPGFLVAADPDRLLPVLGRVTTGEGRRAAALYRRSTDHLGTTDSAIRASYLELTARCIGSDQLADEFARAQTGRPWRTCWSRWRPASNHRMVITGHKGWIHGIAAELLRDGTPVVATASSDSTVRVWDLDTGRPYGRPFTESHAFANAVAIGTSSDGTPVIVAACGGLRGPGTIHRWNLESGESLGPTLHGHHEPIGGVQIGQLGDGTKILISMGTRSSKDTPGTIRIWNLSSGEPIGKPFNDHRAEITAMTIHTSAAGTTVVSADSAAMLHIWDAETRDAYTRELRLYDAEIIDIREVSTAKLHGRPIVVVSCFFKLRYGTSGPLLWAWDLASGEPVSEPIRPDSRSPIFGLTAATLPGGQVAIIAGVNDALQAWDLDTGEALMRPLYGHTNRVTRVTVAKRRDGRLVAVSGGPDRTVRIWELDPESHADQRDSAPPITAMATGTGPGGRPVITINQGSHVEVDDVASGIRLASLSRVQPGAVIGMGLLPRCDSQPPVVAVVARDYSNEFGWHGTVWIADLPLPASPQNGPLVRWLRRRRVPRPPRQLRIGSPTAIAFTVLPLGDPAIVYSTLHDKMDHKDHYFYVVRIDNLASGGTWGAAMDMKKEVNAVTVGRTRDDTLVVAAGGGTTYEPTNTNINTDKSDYTIRVWVAHTGELLSELTGHTAQVNAVASGHPSALPAVVGTGSGSENSLSSQDDCSVRVWNLETGRPHGQPLLGHTSPVTAVAIAEMADGMPVVASGSGSAGTIRVWNLMDGTPRIRPFVLVSHN